MTFQYLFKLNKDLMRRYDRKKSTVKCETSPKGKPLSITDCVLPPIMAIPDMENGTPEGRKGSAELSMNTLVQKVQNKDQGKESSHPKQDHKEKGNVSLRYCHLDAKEKEASTLPHFYKDSLPFSPPSRGKRKSGKRGGSSGGKTHDESKVECNDAASVTKNWNSNVPNTETVVTGDVSHTKVATDEILLNESNNKVPMSNYASLQNKTKQEELPYITRDILLHHSDFNIPYRLKMSTMSTTSETYSTYSSLPSTQSLKEFSSTAKHPIEDGLLNQMRNLKGRLNCSVDDGSDMLFVTPFSTGSFSNAWDGPKKGTKTKKGLGDVTYIMKRLQDAEQSDYPLFVAKHSSVLKAGGSDRPATRSLTHQRQALKSSTSNPTSIKTDNTGTSDDFKLQPEKGEGAESFSKKQETPRSELKSFKALKAKMQKMNSLLRNSQQTPAALQLNSSQYISNSVPYISTSSIKNVVKKTPKRSKLPHCLHDTNSSPADNSIPVTSFGDLHITSVNKVKYELPTSRTSSQTTPRDSKLEYKSECPGENSTVSNPQEISDDVNEVEGQPRMYTMLMGEKRVILVDKNKCSQRDFLHYNHQLQKQIINGALHFDNGECGYMDSRQCVPPNTPFCEPYESSFRFEEHAKQSTETDWSPSVPLHQNDQRQNGQSYQLSTFLSHEESANQVHEHCDYYHNHQKHAKELHVHIPRMQVVIPDAQSTTESKVE